MQATGMVRPEGVPTLASWGRRLAAYLIDQMLILLTTVPGFALLGLALAADPDNEPLTAAGLVLVVAALFLVPPIYYTVMHGRSGQTYAKRWLGLKVVDAETAATIGYGRAFGRWLLYFVLNFVCAVLVVLDGLWPLWDAQNQTWHDKAVSSVVIHLPD
ncbi:MAG TPA: RDD family protein [Gaiellaceae bacterium]